MRPWGAVFTAVPYIIIFELQKHFSDLRGVFNKFPDFFCTGI